MWIVHVCQKVLKSKQTQNNGWNFRQIWNRCVCVIGDFTNFLWQHHQAFIRKTEKWIFWICLQSWSNILVCEKICKFLLLRVFCVDFRQNYYKYFHMGFWWSWWHVYVTEQVIKSGNQIKRVNNLQRIIWRNTMPN